MQYDKMYNPSYNIITMTIKCHYCDNDVKVKEIRASITPTCLICHKTFFFSGDKTFTTREEYISDIFIRAFSSHRIPTIKR